ncbi:hypothetical protein [Streptomyces sp. NRRL B-24720]|uniref:hypothetical protein n=1 Tax=Streptomyces sp. NRRL B-24720 TaxID=1476876 RepID=UPI0004C51819|nr:hypothetical protein [Streptomyces sp. NRRL B-24720]
MQGDYGDLQLGRLLLRETFKAGEASSDSRTMELEGQESSPPLTRAALVWRHDNLCALDQGCILPVTWTDKPERNGYYQVGNASADYTEYRGEVLTSDWKVSLTRLGSDAETDLQSRLTGVVRANDFSLTGERWHAPPIGHYGYYTGASNPTTMTRTGADGAMTVYRGVPANVSPRWGCAPTNYLTGRVRLTSSGTELCGTDQALPSTGWALTNGLVNVTTSASATLDVQAYTGGAWRSKLWNVSVAGSASSITSWDGATLLRNEPEQVILRLTKGLNPGRATLDLALRRGSRFVEGYLQIGTSATLAAYRSTLETNTSAAASGYVVATNDDGDSNRFAIGSARSFTAHSNGGITKAATTTLDFWIGVVASQAPFNNNPDVETDLTGWTGLSCTIARVATPGSPPFSSAWSIRVTPDGVSSSGSAAQTPHSTVGSIVPGTSYTCSYWVYSPAGWSDFRASIDWFDASDVAISSSSSTVQVISAGQWTYVVNTATAPANASRAAARARQGATPAVSDVWYVDRIMLRPDTAAGDAATDLRNQYIAAMPESTYAVRR